MSTYLTEHISKSALEYFKPYFNINGRAFPDVSAHSLHPEYVLPPHFNPTSPLAPQNNSLPSYAVIINNLHTLSGGTSAATPVFAAIIALLNDARLRSGKKPLGFLNPWLYSVGSKGLTDITAGGSVGCNGINGQTGKPVVGGGVIPYASWNATVGWDPGTGLGVPDFGGLLGLVVG